MAPDSEVGMLRLLISQTRVVMTTLVLLLVAGAYAYVNIPKEANPDIPIPTMYVSLAYVGISPEDAVNQLLKPVEQEMRGLTGLDTLEGTAYEGGANLVITFQAGFDPKSALADVREKVDIAKADLPDGAEEPVVTEINLALFPIVTVVLSGDVPERTLKRHAEDLQDRIESLPGVLEAEVNGLREEILLVELDKAQLESFRLPLAEVVQAVQANNALVAAGSLETGTGKYAIKVPGLLERPDDLLNIPLASVDGKTIRVRDVGTVKLAFRDASVLARVDGKPALTLGVKKRIGENIIDTVDAVRKVVADEAQSWPATMQYRLINDESVRIRTMLSDLENNVLIATLLVMLVVLLALGWRGATLVAMTVPGSFLAAILLLYLMGFTTNVVVLFALILSVGILVDGAIVVGEMAETLLAQGKRKQEAYIEAAQYMAWPVAASTGTILCAFLPLLFWPDTVGEFMKFMPITLAFTLTASWVMAMVFLPALGGLLPGTPKPPPPGDIYDRLAQRYVRWLDWALTRPRAVVIWSFALLVAIWGVYAVGNHGVEFFPRIEPDRVELVVHAGGDMSLLEKDAIMRRVEAPLLTLDGVQTVSLRSGGSGGRSGPSDTIGSATLELAEWSTGRPTADTIMANALRAIGPIPGVTLEQKTERKGPQQGKPIQLVVEGPDMGSIRPVATALRQKLAEIPGVRDIDDDMPKPGIEWAMRVKRVEASQLGTDIAAIGQTLRLATNGAIVGKYRPDNRKEELDIVARLRDDQRTLTTLDTITVATAGGRVPVGDVVERVAVPKVDVLHRTDQKNSVTVEADVDKGTLASEVVKVIRAELAKTKLPQGVTIDFKGDQDKQDTAAGFLKVAFMVAVFLIALIMLIEFNSFYQTFVVLTAVVFSTGGVLLGHIFTGTPFGIIMSGLGIIALAGIIVSNNIVLIDTYNKLRADGPWRQALRETCRLRLRPVLLTQITTAIGLLPMASRITIDVVNRSVSYNAPSAQWWDQLAIAIVFGALFGSLLTLVVTPCMLAWQEMRRERTHRG
ncbi:MAG: efflux RND transporter permease subunit [Pseudomonadaceae bacterium]|nr:efflux RND transporter permease subunit [Pseudomonadaceae bacterium]